MNTWSNRTIIIVWWHTVLKNLHFIVLQYSISMLIMSGIAVNYMHNAVIHIGKQFLP